MPGWPSLVVGAVLGIVSSNTETGNLRQLPEDIAQELRWLAFNDGWKCVNNKEKNRGDEEADKLRAEQHFARMKDLGTGLLTDAMARDLRWMSHNAAWAVMNEPKNHADVARLDGHQAKLAATGVLSKELLTNIRWMMWNTACASKWEIVKRGERRSA